MSNAVFSHKATPLGTQSAFESMYLHVTMVKDDVGIRLKFLMLYDAL